MSVIERNIEEMKEELKQRFVTTAQINYGRELSGLDEHEIYETLAQVVKQYTSENWIKTNKQYQENDEKQVYYFSIEFLLGRLLNTNLINLDLKNALKAMLKELNLDLNNLYSEEPDAGLGNGGLGRLAACFVDSMASLGLPAHGCGIRYQYGLFEQKIVNDQQVEIPDNWLRNGFAWEFRKPNKAVKVRLDGEAYMRINDDGTSTAVHEGYTEVTAVPYDVPVIGYKNRTVNTLRLWNAEAGQDFSDYATLTNDEIKERQEYRNNVNKITEFLYPEDSTNEGKRLRLIQEYFFVSAGVQSIVRHYMQTHDDLYGFADKVCIQINDTHPAVAVAELMRVFIDDCPESAKG